MFIVDRCFVDRRFRTSFSSRNRLLNGLLFIFASSRSVGISVGFSFFLFRRLSSFRYVLPTLNTDLSRSFLIRIVLSDQGSGTRPVIIMTLVPLRRGSKHLFVWDSGHSGFYRWAWIVIGVVVIVIVVASWRDTTRRRKFGLDRTESNRIHRPLFIVVRGSISFCSFLSSSSLASFGLVTIFRAVSNHS